MASNHIDQAVATRLKEDRELRQTRRAREIAEEVARMEFEAHGNPPEMHYGRAELVRLLTTVALRGAQS